MFKKITLLACSLASFFAHAQTSPAYNYYYGNLHAHSSYSDGNKDVSATGHATPYQNYMYASGSLNFDFLGISEHNHATAGMHISYYAKGLRQADSATVDGQFVALYGMEWGTISGGGHVLIYGVNKLLGWEGGNYNTFVQKGNYQALFREVNKYPAAFATLAHPNNSDFGNLVNANTAFNFTADSVVVGTVMRSGPAFSTNTTYLNPSSGSYESYYRKMLAKGYHVGISVDHDNHNTTFGRSTPGRLVVLAPALTKTDLVEALRARRFYASDDWNTQVAFTLNNQPIGSIHESYTAANVQLNVTDPDNEPLQSIKLLRGIPGSGVQAVTVASAGSGANSITFVDTISGGSAYYYAVIIQSDGDRIVTSPIWYTRSTTSGLNDAQQQVALNVFPNPVSNAPLTISYYLSDPETVTINILDALGRKVKTIAANELQHSGSHSYTIRLNNGELGDNMYIVQFSSGQHVTYRKLIIAR